MTLLWDRSQNSTDTYSGGAFRLAAMQNGWTIKRVRFGWGYVGFTEVTVDLHNVALNVLYAGIVSTIGNGTETVPAPITTPGDVAPPTQRWLWWEGRQPVCHSTDAYGNVAAWRDGGGQDVTDAQTQILATGIPAGQFLNLWFSWQSFNGAWDASGQQRLYQWSSVLYHVP